MIIALQEIKNAESGLKKLMSYELPIKTSYLLQRNIKVLNDEFINIEKAKSEIVKKYGKPNKENPELYDIDTDKYILFVQEFNEFLQTEITIDIAVIKLDDLPDDIKISSIELDTLIGKFIEV